MADTPSDNDIMQGLIGKGSSIIDAFQGVGEEVDKVLAKAGINGAKQITKNIIAEVNSLKVRISQMNLLENLINPDKLTSQFSDVMKQMEEVLGRSEIAQMAFGLDEKSMRNVMGSLAEITNAEYGVKLTAYIGGGAALDQIKEITKTVTEAEKKILELTQSAYENVRANTASRAVDVLDEDQIGVGSRDFSTLQSASNRYRQEIIKLQSDWGVAGEEAKEAIDAMLGAGVAIDRIGNLSAKLTKGKEPIKGLSAAFAVAKATGLSYVEVGSAINSMTRELGVDTKNAAQQIEVLERVQSGTSMKIGTIKKDIFDAANAFQFFGNNIDGASALYKGFLKSLGEGREALASKIFDGMIAGIKGMDDGMKAFLAMTTGIGTGGGGALGGVLEVEQAFATGKGLDKVVAGIKESVESLSGGAPLMSREEAIESGQQAQYYKQREILSMQTGVQDKGQLDLIIKMLQSQDLSAIREALAPGSATGGFNEGRIQQEALVGAGGKAAVMLNRLEATRTAAQEGIAEGIVSAGTKFNESSKVFATAIKNVQTLFNSENFTNLFKEKLEGSKFQGQDTSAQRADERVAKERSGEVTADQSSLNRLNAANKALDKTGMVLAEKLNASIEAAAATQSKALAELNDSTTTFAKTGAVLANSLNELAKNKAATGEVGLGNLEREVLIKVKLEVDDAGQVNFRQIAEALVSAPIE